MWPIPVKWISVVSNLSGFFIMKEKEHTLTIEGLSEEDFVKFNHDLAGFYISNYQFSPDPNTTASLKQVIGLLRNVTKLNVIDRYGLLSDLIFTECMAFDVFTFFSEE
jgi:hypothetical protein